MSVKSTKTAKSETAHAHPLDPLSADELRSTYPMVPYYLSKVVKNRAALGSRAMRSSRVSRPVVR